MRRLILALVAVLALAGGVAQADHDAEQSNTHGKCTAYFNGSENGQNNKRNSTAFQEFASYVGENDHVDNDGDDEVDEEGEVADPLAIWDWCNGENNPKGIGGQPDDPNTEGNDGNGNNGKGNG